ncbi:hypothetical protein AVEN_40970-1 [Araneus ventricosus]|uniref:Uncharacterized protein n=1 Tax=Araneus ventricosus TaxID=182803 RepID=A0A4Y2FCV0_ARAVE|nr:hypothetical protein AVEN_40970-1 [Araneus ventricosus]
MKQVDCQDRRKQETDDEEEGNAILMEESEDEYFGCFQEKIEAVEMEEVIYLESTNILDFSTNIFVLIDNVGGTRIKAHYSYVCGIQGLDYGEMDMIDSKTTNLAKSKFVSV